MSARKPSNCDAHFDFDKQQAKRRKSLAALAKLFKQFRADVPDRPNLAELRKDLADAETRRKIVEHAVTIGKAIVAEGFANRIEPTTVQTADPLDHVPTFFRWGADEKRQELEDWLRELPSSNNDCWLLILWTAIRGFMPCLEIGAPPGWRGPNDPIIPRPPKAPGGWEGPYLERIETVSDFIRWIDGEFQTWDFIGEYQGSDRSSKGRRVRNAYLLLTELGLRGAPPEPPGPFTVRDEFRILRDLKRLAAAQVKGDKALTAAHAAPAPSGQFPTAEAPGKLSATKKRILSICRKKYLPGSAIARNIEMSYDHTRRLLAQLVKAGYLKNGPQGYHTTRRV